MSDSLFMIVDGSSNVLTLSSVKMFGKNVEIPAIFNREDDALEVLFAIEKMHPEVPKHAVIRISSALTVHPLDAFSDKIEVIR